MEKSQESKTYPLPLEITPRFPFLFLLLFFTMGPFLILMPFIIPFEEMEGSVLFRILMYYLLCPALGLAFIVGPIIMNVMKKSRIIIDEHGMRFKTLFIRKMIMWDDVVDVETFSMNYNDFLGIVTRDKVEKVRKGGALAYLNASYGGMYGAQIALKQIGKLDREKLVYTIKEVHRLASTGKHGKAKDEEISAEVRGLSEVSRERELETSFFKAGLFSLAAALGVGIVYALSILLLELNILVLPVFGVAIIFYYFYKYIQREEFNFLCRIWVAALGIVSVFTARIFLTFAYNKMIPNPGEVLSLVYEYFFEYLPYNIGDELVWVIVSGITAVMGLITGPNLKIFRS
ncbi:MAG: hypothetical protein ACOCW1_05350 [Chitinispirillaceae bacterium]